MNFPGRNIKEHIKFSQNFVRTHTIFQEIIYLQNRYFAKLPRRMLLVKQIESFLYRGSQFQELTIYLTIYKNFINLIHIYLNVSITEKNFRTFALKIKKCFIFIESFIKIL